MTKKIILPLLFIVFISCNKKKETTANSEVLEAYLETPFDTLKLNEVNELSFKFISSKDYSTFDKEKLGFKLLDGCITFNSLDKAQYNKNNFDSKCDSILSKKTKLKDTFSIDFNFIPNKKGGGKFFLKLKEIVYLKPHKDSIRKMENEFFTEGEYYVIE
ncbi:hypothetical protein [Flavivirga jejuensis]|uniref:Lipoprotein n=1 Tax=Flavivirga jejuensis TaxID=870487 RepID=A0ABT8WQR5_9FLAO|nr:hypothetical protein [Flavivirga jejuensis]MDO5975488.1 hypothetical protein [Flavivirga jejuensis]